MDELTEFFLDYIKNCYKEKYPEEYETNYKKGFEEGLYISKVEIIISLKDILDVEKLAKAVDLTTLEVQKIIDQNQKSNDTKIKKAIEKCDKKYGKALQNLEKK